jgi:hypothetical protein
MILTQAEAAILDRNWPRSRTIRSSALPFLHLNRDSRLSMGMFRTEDEQDKFKADGLRRKLPEVSSKPRIITTRS